MVCRVRFLRSVHIKYPIHEVVDVDYYGGNGGFPYLSRTSGLVAVTSLFSEVVLLFRAF